MVPSSIYAFAGVDGGATKTRARVTDCEGRLIGEGRAGPGSLTLSPEIAAANCRKALQQALAESGVVLSSCRVVFGVAGHRQPAKRIAFEHAFTGVGSFDVISDGYAALLGAHRGAPGAIVITGTGSVALSLREDGKIRQVGGYGPVVGDEGGGNWLGRRAVRATLRAMDAAAAGEVSMSPMFMSIVDLMGRDHEAMLDWIATADATRFAALVPLLLRYEAEGDPLAKRLLGEAAEEVGRLVRLIGANDEFPVSLCGGLADTLAPRLSSELRSRLDPPAGDSIDGALLRAMQVAPSEVYA